MIYDLPELPDGLTWSIQEYVGNYDDGVYPLGSRVTVGIRKRGRFMFWATNFHLGGVKIRIVDPSLGEAAIRSAADDVFAAYILQQVNSAS